VRRAGALVLGASLCTGLFAVPAAGADCTSLPRKPDRPEVEVARAKLRGASSVRLLPGKDKRVHYRLRLPASPTPLDIFFLLDTTGSMDAAICSVKLALYDIAFGLEKTGIDVNFGLGWYRDYPIAPYGDPGDTAYKLEHKIGPLDEAMIETLHGLDAGGGFDGPESALPALYQAATGEGQDVAPPGSSPADIPDGGEAGFREGGLRVIVNVTDAPFNKGRAYPGPAWADVVEALRGNDVYQVGIAVGNRNQDLERMAFDTDAVAPKGGLDCDGDGSADLDKGLPLVCSMGGGSVNLAPTIVSMVKAIEDIASVKFRAAGAAEVVAAVKPPVVPDLDITRPHRAAVRVRYHCDKPNGEHMVELVASVRGIEVARTRTTVTCDAPPAVLPIVQAAGIAAAPAPAPQPAPQTNPQVQPQPGAQPAGALAGAPAQAPNLATASSSDTGDETLQMSRARATPPLAWMVIVLAMSAGAASMLSTAKRPQQATARRDR